MAGGELASKDSRGHGQKAELASSPSTPTEGTVQPPGSMTLRVSVSPKGQEVPD